MLVSLVMISVSGCASVLRTDSLCLNTTKPPYTEKDIHNMSDGFARWTLNFVEIWDTICKPK